MDAITAGPSGTGELDDNQACIKIKPSGGGSPYTLTITQTAGATTARREPGHV